MCAFLSLSDVKLKDTHFQSCLHLFSILVCYNYFPSLTLAVKDFESDGSSLLHPIES